MIKIRMFDNNDIMEVTPDIARDLIDRKRAELYRRRVMPYRQFPTAYQNRQMRAERRALRNKGL